VERSTREVNKMVRNSLQFKCWWHENGEQGECELMKTIPNRRRE
jgi:hypothetical protein